MQINELEELLGKRIIAAYLIGMSVVEITKLLRRSRVEYVHSLLRNSGHIPAMIRSEYRRAYDIDCRLAKELKSKGYSFGRWCLGWKLHSVDAAKALKTPPSEAPEVHAALQRDFPWTYCKIYGGLRPPKTRSASKAHENWSVIISWDTSCYGYVAKVIEQPEIEGIGYDWTEALEKMSTACRFYENIASLDSAITGYRSH